METLAERLIWARTEAKLTQTALAQKAGVSQGTIGNIESGLRQRPRELLAIAAALGLRAEWLQDGIEPREAPARVGETPSRYLVGETHVLVGAPDRMGEMVFVPAVRGARLSAGTGEVVYDIDEEVNAVAFRLDWMQSKGLRPERCKVWKVRGDSMEPRYSSGDSLLIDMSDRAPKHGKYFALVGEDGLRVKQLRAIAGGGWEMFSLNPDKVRYPTEPIVHDNFAIIGRVRGRSGDED